MPTTNGDRRQELAQVAAGVFVRYGFRKTSVDDVARAARISRQGLYFHFPSKEALFREVIRYLAELALQAAIAAIANKGAPLEDRLLAAFKGMYTGVFDGQDARNLEELFASATELASDLVQAHEKALLATFARAIEQETCRQRRGAGLLTPTALAEHLYAVSYGIKHRTRSAEEYLSRMKVAIRLVCGSISA